MYNSTNGSNKRITYNIKVTICGATFYSFALFKDPEKTLNVAKELSEKRISYRVYMNISDKKTMKSQQKIVTISQLEEIVLSQS